MIETITDNHKLDGETVKLAAHGRWPEILSHLGGVDLRLLDGRHHPCPHCGGKDRFRSFNDGTGGAICNQCFATGNGDGLATLGWLRGTDFQNTLHHVAEFLGLGKRDPLKSIAIEKHVDAESLQQYGAESRGGEVVVPMWGADGSQCSEYTLRPGGGKGLCAKGKPAGLFLPQLDGKVRQPKPGETWLGVEGVKDASAWSSLGYLAVGLPTSSLNAKFASLFNGVDVILVPDRDRAGETGAQKTAKVLHDVAGSVSVATLPIEFTESGGGDVRDLLTQKDGEQQARQAVDQAQRVGQDGKTQQRIDYAWITANELATTRYELE